MVISPLTGLMIDQKASFTSKGITAEFVGMAQDDDASVQMVIDGNAQLVFISPENIICNPVYRRMLQSKKYKEKLVGLVVDEAHCIKTW